jgi:hypothetical protein
MGIQGFEPRGSLSGNLTQATFPFIVSNGVLVTAGNAVALVSGYVENIDAIDGGDVGVLGVAVETVTGNSSSATCAIICDPNVVYYNDADGNVAQADIGKVYQTVIASGKMKIDQSTGAATSGNKFVLIKKDPDDDKDASKGLFKIYTSQLLNRSTDT